MASATVTAHHPRSSFSAPSSATARPSSDHGATLSNTPVPSQSLPPSQQPFSGPKMSLSQSSQGGLAASAAAGAYRQSQHHNNQHQHQQSSQPPMYDPSVYLAVYSGIEVYETEVNAVHVMRRRKDGWLNATQILKVAGVDKGKRTKILEKEIQTGEHEKVQGGYGKYQGTWINYDRGVEVCQLYGVEDVLRGLLTYNIGDTLDPNLNTPTKEQAMAAQRKRMYSASSQESRQQQQPGTFFRNISPTASTALSAINKARFDGRPGYASSMRPGSSLSRAPSFNRQQQEDTPMNSQQSYLHSSQPDFDGAFSQPGSQQQQQQVRPDGLEPPRKRQRIVTPAGSFGPGSLQYDPATAAYANEYPGSPTEPNESFVYTQAGLARPDSQPASQQHQQQQHQPQYEPLPPLPMDMSPEAQHKRSILMSLFMEPGGNNAADTARYTQTLQSMSPLDLDMPIDNHSHTSLHWAATLSRTGLLRALISSGASPYRVNAGGETALMRAALVTNSMEFSTFPDLLDVLGSTIDVVDNKGRTVLHHIAVASAVKGRNAASKYYLESLLEWVVRQGSAPASSAPGSSQTGSSQQQQPPPSRPRMNLRRFMDEIVNAQDHSGDTALNIAARIGNRSIISQLIEVGADCTIANRAGLRPQDFGVGGENGEDNMDQSMVDGSSQPQGNGQPTRQSSDDIVTSITALLSETSSNFQSELKTKQRNVDSLTTSIRTISTSLAESKKALEAKQTKVRLQQLARRRVVNYSRANEEEKFRLADLERAQPRVDVMAVEKWKTMTEPESVGPSILRARIKALKARTEAMQRATAGLQTRSKDVELKYRKVVSLCTGALEGDVEGVIDSLLRAVESEKGELELGRVRRFLGGVETVG
ncbi:Start control protein cdc10 [Zalerion maritima]|uniref:Transcription factor SWI6 n=1 Tax=Zalerion maritima TaxID=339359 RepID=A0AAD5RNT6_9PEZI|nr:Start control protein cdc10 [Zalerion maritima]